MSDAVLEYLQCQTCGMDVEDMKERCVIGCADCLLFFRDVIVYILLKHKNRIKYSGGYKK